MPRQAASYKNQTEEQSAKRSSEKFPWSNKKQGKNTEQFNLRLSEVELEKLRYIALNTPYSMQAFTREVLMSAIDKKINEITTKAKAKKTKS